MKMLIYWSKGLFNEKRKYLTNCCSFAFHPPSYANNAKYCVEEGRKIDFHLFDLRIRVIAGKDC